MTSQARLQAFLYILMRDKLTSGGVEAVMDHLRSIDKNKAESVKFSAPHLAAYALELADEILEATADREKRASEAKQALKRVRLHLRYINEFGWPPARAGTQGPGGHFSSPLPEEWNGPSDEELEKMYPDVVKE